MDTTWLNFTGFDSQNLLNQNFSDTQIKSSEEQKAIYEKVANACNNWYEPVLADSTETSIEATPIVGVGVGVVEVVPIDLKESNDIEALTKDKTAPAVDSKSLTIPPLQIQQNDLLKAVMIGLGVVVVLKILE